MTNVLVKAKRLKLYFLMKAVSNYYGGDVKKWLDDYFLNIAHLNRHSLDKLIRALEDIVKTDRIPLPERHGDVILTCKCGFMGAFCRCVVDV